IDSHLAEHQLKTAQIILNNFHIMSDSQGKLTSSSVDSAIEATLSSDPRAFEKYLDDRIGSHSRHVLPLSLGATGLLGVLAAKIGSKSLWVGVGISLAGILWEDLIQSRYGAKRSVLTEERDQLRDYLNRPYSKIAF